MSKLHLAIVLVAATALSGSCVRACGCSPIIDPGGFVSVSVRDQGGMPVPEARLHLVPDVGAPSIHGRVGPTGTIVALLPPGPYSLTFDLPPGHVAAPGQPDTIRLVVVEEDTVHALYRTIAAPASP